MANAFTVDFREKYEELLNYLESMSSDSEG